MPTKLQNVQELMKDRISSLWKNPENYVSFLETASRLYKYSFKDQILIHAQRPDPLPLRRFYREVQEVTGSYDSCLPCHQSVASLPESQTQPMS